jgi:hypothetical protein
MKKQLDMFDLMFEQEELNPVKTPSQQDLKYDEWYADLTSTKTPVCTCGVWSVYGKDIDISFHKDYCDLRN